MEIRTRAEDLSDHQNLQAFVVRQLFVKRAIGSFRLGEPVKFSDGFIHLP
jgi:hypothetical protein